MNALKQVCCLLFTWVFLSNVVAQPQYAYRISFIDKQGSPSLANPLLFLSQRSLDRRAQQSISLNENDRPVSSIYLDSVIFLTQGKFHVSSKWLNTCVLLLNDSSKINQLQGNSFVTSYQYIAYYATALHNLIPEKSEKEGNQELLFSKTAADPAFYGVSWDQTQLVKGQCLHDAGHFGEGKLIAVLDDGFNHVLTNPAFDSLVQSGRILDKYNFVKADTNVFQNHAHGTQVLSTMAVLMPNSYVGAAPKAQFALYVTEDQNSEQPIEMDNLIAGLERADSLGADIITTSLGYNFFTGPVTYTIPASDMDGKTTPAAKAMNIASSKGILTIATMGNEGSLGLLTPGDADSALTIGNVNINKVPAGNSGYGPNAAGHTKPDVCAMGNPAAVISNSTSAFFINGTSMSTPQISGFAACLWQALPSKASWAIRELIQKSAPFYSNPMLPQLGYGVPDFCTALSVQENHPGNNQIVVGPNPFTDHLDIKFSHLNSATSLFTLFDINGRIVLSQQLPSTLGVQKLEFKLKTDLPKGMYFCKIVQPDFTQVFKLIKE